MAQQFVMQEQEVQQLEVLEIQELQSQVQLVIQFTIQELQSQVQEKVHQLEIHVQLNLEQIEVCLLGVIELLSQGVNQQLEGLQAHQVEVVLLKEIHLQEILKEDR